MFKFLSQFVPYHPLAAAGSVGAGEEFSGCSKNREESQEGPTKEEKNKTNHSLSLFKMSIN
jgi:hypothetical protein